MSAVLETPLVSQVYSSQQDHESAYALTCRETQPLQSYLKALRHESRRRLILTTERRDTALFFFTNIIIPGREGKMHPLFFAGEGSALYSNFRVPETKPEQIFVADGQGHTHKVRGLSQTELFRLLRWMASSQGLLPARSASDFDNSFKQIQHNSRPLLSGLLALRRQTNGQFGFTLARVHNDLSVNTNLAGESPTASGPAAAWRNILLVYGQQGWMAYHLPGIAEGVPAEVPVVLGCLKQVAAARKLIAA